MRNVNTLKKHNRIITGITKCVSHRAINWNGISNKKEMGKLVAYILRFINTKAIKISFDRKVSRVIKST